jgi:hypothetical protein
MSADMSSYSNSHREPLAGGRAFRLSLIGWCLASGLLIMTFVPEAPAVPSWLMFALMGGAIFVGAYTIAGHRGVWTRRVRISKDDALKNIPTGLRRAVQAFVLAMIVISALAFVHLTGGQAEIIHGRYYLNDHGSLTQVTRAAYERSRIWEGRLFTAIPAVFFLAAACLNYRPPE